jgi:hypothetical protein
MKKEQGKDVEKWKKEREEERKGKKRRKIVDLAGKEEAGNRKENRRCGCGGKRENKRK